MSRVANSPVAVPKGVDINIDGVNISVKGGKGSLDSDVDQWYWCQRRGRRRHHYL